MTMLVRNNFTPTRLAVNLNRNTNWLNKSLIKLLTKQKINSAVDNASNFSLSERMIAELRALNQTDHNVQEGSSIVKIAKDATHIIINVLQDMRSFAFAATSNSTTDVERQLLQKKMMQSLATINDIANATKYKGVGLIDGTYDGGNAPTSEVVGIKKINPQEFTLLPTETYVKEVFVNGERMVINENKVEELTREFTVTNSSITRIDSDDTASLKSNTKPKLDCDLGFSGRYPKSTWNWATAYRATLAPGETLIGSSSMNSKVEIGVELNFAGAKGYNGDAIPEAFHNQGFSILCNGCTQYINVVFDKTMNIGQGTLTTYENNVLRKDFRVGIGDATSIDDLPRAIFEGIKNSGRDPKDVAYDARVRNADGTEEVVAVTIDKGRHNFRVAKNPNYNNGSSSEYLFIKEYDWSMLFIDSGTILALGEEGSKDNLPQGTVTQAGTATQPEIQKVSVDTPTTVQIWDAEKEIIETTTSVGNPLVIQDGTRVGEYDAYYIKGMQTKNLKIGNIFDDEGNFLNIRDRIQYEALSTQPDKQKVLLDKWKEEESTRGDIISVKTVTEASKAINLVDRALEYALKNATVLGAYLQRMGNDQDRILGMERSTDQANSAIRDIDTKERIAYARAHVLTKASQLMFAQANQNSFSVLHLVE